MRASCVLAEDTGPPLFSAGGIELDYEFDELRTHRKFKAIRIEDPLIRVDDDGLAGLKKGRSAARNSGTETPPALRFLGQFTDSLTVTV